MRILEQAIRRVLLSELHFTEEAQKQLQQVAETIAAHSDLKTLFEQYYTDQIMTGNWVNVWHVDTPDREVEAAFHEQYTLFYLLCYLEKLFDTKQQYQKLGIPESIYVDTLSDIGVWLENWKDRYGYYCFMNLGWIWRHLDVRLFRIGRLQYQLNTYNGDIVAFKNRVTGITVTFSTNELLINANGDMTGAGGLENDPVCFSAKPVTITADMVQGYPVTPYGKVDNKPVTLVLSEWEKVFGAGDKVLELHIPRSGAFDVKNCRESFEAALKFYQQYIHESSVKGLFCHTWIFTPQLQEMLSPDSNLVKFQREFYLQPNAGNYRFMWNFVFHETIQLDNAPRDTHLRRMLLDYIHQGKPVFDLKGICLHTPQDWGKQLYMNSYDNGEWKKIYGKF